MSNTKSNIIKTIYLFLAFILIISLFTSFLTSALDPSVDREGIRASIEPYLGKYMDKTLEIAKTAKAVIPESIDNDKFIIKAKVPIPGSSDVREVLVQIYKGDIHRGIENINGKTVLGGGERHSAARHGVIRNGVHEQMVLGEKEVASLSLKSVSINEGKLIIETHSAEEAAENVFRALTNGELKLSKSNELIWKIYPDGTSGFSVFSEKGNIILSFNAESSSSPILRLQSHFPKDMDKELKGLLKLSKLDKEIGGSLRDDIINALKLGAFETTEGKIEIPLKTIVQQGKSVYKIADEAQSVIDLASKNFKLLNDNVKKTALQQSASKIAGSVSHNVQQVLVKQNIPAGTVAVETLTVEAINTLDYSVTQRQLDKAIQRAAKVEMGNSISMSPWKIAGTSLVVFGGALSLLFDVTSDKDIDRKIADSTGDVVVTALFLIPTGFTQIAGGGYFIVRGGAEFVEESAERKKEKLNEHTLNQIRNIEYSSLIENYLNGEVSWDETLNLLLQKGFIREEEYQNLYTLYTDMGFEQGDILQEGRDDYFAKLLVETADRNFRERFGLGKNVELGISCLLSSKNLEYSPVDIFNKNSRSLFEIKKVDSAEQKNTKEILKEEGIKERKSDMGSSSMMHQFLEGVIPAGFDMKIIEKYAARQANEYNKHYNEYRAAVAGASASSSSSSSSGVYVPAAFSSQANAQQANFNRINSYLSSSTGNSGGLGLGSSSSSSGIGLDAGTSSRSIFTSGIGLTNSREFLSQSASSIIRPLYHTAFTPEAIAIDKRSYGGDSGSSDGKVEFDASESFMDAIRSGVIIIEPGSPMEKYLKNSGKSISSETTNSGSGGNNNGAGNSGNELVSG